MNHYLRLKERRAERIPIGLTALLERNGSPPIKVELLDISPRGIRCQTLEWLPIGSAVAVEIGGVPIRATVAWQLGNDAGLQFETGLAWRTVFATLLDSVDPDRPDRATDRHRAEEQD